MIVISTYYNCILTSSKQIEINGEYLVVSLALAGQGGYDEIDQNPLKESTMFRGEIIQEFCLRIHRILRRNYTNCLGTDTNTQRRII